MVSQTPSPTTSGVSRNLLLLGLASLFTDMSSHIVFPLVPLFLSNILGASAVIIGLVEGASETVSAALKALGGKWSDRVRKRKPFIVAGYALSAVTKSLFAFATAWPLVFGARAIERIGKGLRSAPRDALIADEAHILQRGRAFGFQRAMDGLGGLLGACAAYVLMGITGYREAFLIALVPGLIAVIFTLMVKEAPQLVDANAPIISPPRLRDLSGNLKSAIAGCALFALAQFGIAFFLLAAQIEGLSARDAIGFYILFTLSNTLASQPAGRASDRFGRRPVLIVGYALFCVACLVMLSGQGLWGLALAFFVYGTAMALVDGTQRAMIADLAPQNLRATAMGAYHAAIAFVALPGGFIAGMIWEQLDPSYTFVFGIALSAVAILFIRKQIESKTS